MASAQQIESYVPNPELGIGASPEISVLPQNPELKAVEQSGRDLLLLNAEKNQKVWQQKVKDRDTLLQLIQDDKIQSGNVLDRDRPVVKSALDNMDKAFNDMMKAGGISNIDAYTKYQKAKRDAQDTVNQAQFRELFWAKNQGEIAKETLPRKKEAMQKSLEENYSKGFFSDLTPYQQTLDFTLDPIYKIPQKISVKYQDPTNPLILGTRDYYDYGQIANDMKNKYLEAGEEAYDMQQALQQYQKKDPKELQTDIDNINARIDEYNAKMGKTVDHVKTETLPNGTVLIKETTPDFASKLALAHIPVYDTKSIDEKSLGLLIQKERADSDAIYKRAMAANAGARTRAYVANIGQQMKLRKDQADKDAFLDDMYKRNLTQQPSLIQGLGGGGVALANINADNSLPIFTLEGKTIKQLQPIGGVPVYANGKSLPSKVGEKPLYFKGGHYEPVYMLNGKQIDVRTINDIYSNFKKQQGDKWQGSMDDFIKQAVDAGKFNVLLKGANGTTDEKLSRAAQQIISNLTTKKGQEPVFSEEQPPQDEPVPETPEPQQ